MFSVMYVCQTVSLGVRGDFRAVTCNILDLTTLGPPPPQTCSNLFNLDLRHNPYPRKPGFSKHEVHTIGKSAVVTLMEGFVFVNILIFLLHKVGIIGRSDNFVLQLKFYFLALKNYLSF